MNKTFSFRRRSRNEPTPTAPFKQVAKLGRDDKEDDFFDMILKLQVGRPSRVPACRTLLPSPSFPPPTSHTTLPLFLRFIPIRRRLRSPAGGKAHARWP